MYIKYSQVPDYLLNTELYESFDNVTEDFDIDVGNEYPPENDLVTDFEKFKLMFFVYNRWGPTNGYETSFKIFMGNNKKKVLRFFYQNEDKFDYAKILWDDVLKSKLTFNITVKNLGNSSFKNVTFAVQNDGCFTSFVIPILPLKLLEIKNKAIELLNNISLIVNELYLYDYLSNLIYFQPYLVINPEGNNNISYLLTFDRSGDHFSITLSSDNIPILLNAFMKIKV